MVSKSVTIHDGVNVAPVIGTITILGGVSHCRATCERQRLLSVGDCVRKVPGPSGRALFSEEGGFTFSEAPFEGTLHEGLKKLYLRKASRELHLRKRKFEGDLKGASRGLENGFKGASRGLEGGLKGASPSERFKDSRGLVGTSMGLQGGLKGA